MRKLKEPSSRIHIWIYSRDKERLETLFKHNIGVSRAVREIIHKAVNEIYARSEANMKKVSLSENIADIIAAAEQES